MCDKDTLLICPIWKFGVFVCLLFTEQRYPCGWEIRMWIVGEARYCLWWPSEKFDTAVLLFHTPEKPS